MSLFAAFCVSAAVLLGVLYALGFQRMELLEASGSALVVGLLYALCHLLMGLVSMSSYGAKYAGSFVGRILFFQLLKVVVLGLAFFGVATFFSRIALSASVLYLGLLFVLHSLFIFVWQYRLTRREWIQNTPPPSSQEEKS